MPLSINTLTIKPALLEIARYVFNCSPKEKYMLICIPALISVTGIYISIHHLNETPQNMRFAKISIALFALSLSMCSLYSTILLSRRLLNYPYEARRLGGIIACSGLLRLVASYYNNHRLHPVEHIFNLQGLLMLGCIATFAFTSGITGKNILRT